MNYKLGDKASFSKTITEYDVYSFAGITGDFNPVHVNSVVASKSRFKNQICHGMLVSSFISTILGMYLPGPGTIYLEQNVKFVKPVYINDTIEASVEIVDIEGKIISLKTVICNQNHEVVVDGMAKVLFDNEGV